MGREVRRVPKNWQHPKQKDGRYYPLFDGNFKKYFAEWMEGWEKWQLGLCEQCNKWGQIDPEYKQTTYSEYEGSIPSPDDYMPEWTDEQKTHLMMYETCSEGTPISPAFETPEELARWLADNEASAFGSLTATYEEWLGMAKAGCAPSAVLDSTEVHSGVEYIGSVK
jgi:hypothetical protein